MNGKKQKSVVAKSVVFPIIVRAMHPTQAAGSQVIVTIFYFYR